MKHKRIPSAFLAIVMTISVILPNIMAVNAEELPDNTDAFLTTDDMSIQSTNSLGTMLAAELSAEQEEQMQGNGYAVSAIEMDNRTATVSFQTLEDCTLVVGIYDEANETLLGSGRAEVSKKQREAQIEIEIMEIPEYFYVKGYLIDSYTLAPLSTTYSCSDYTQEMQEFYAKTIYDFDADRVLNFDEDPTNNFAVYADGTVILEPQEGYNNVISADDENAVYVIENADDTVLSLQQGDILAYEYGENDLLIVKVDSLATVGDTATITGAESSLQEVFEFLHIDAEQGMEDAEIAPAEDVEIVEIAPAQGKPRISGSNNDGLELSVEKKLKKDFVNWSPINEKTNNKNNTIPGMNANVTVNGNMFLYASAGAAFSLPQRCASAILKSNTAQRLMSPSLGLLFFHSRSDQLDLLLFQVCLLKLHRASL